MERSDCNISGNQQALVTAALPLEPHGVPIRQMDLLVVKVLQCLHEQLCVAPLVL